ncbi:MAG: iron-containing alcohol dehydrogenase [Pseudomonadota bacterium]
MIAWQSEIERIIEPAVARSAAIREVIIAADVLSGAADLHRRIAGEAPVLLIADDNTLAAAGAAVSAVLEGAGIAVRRYVLPASPLPKPTLALGQAIAAEIAGTEAVPVAVGSGVINDLVKFAAFSVDRPYWCVPTAASMDGYASGGAPLSDAGFKKTIPCRPAAAILADLSVIAAAPVEMTGWGYGDLVGKMPAGADWLIADTLGVEPVDSYPWSLVQNSLRRWLGDPATLAAADPAAVANLFLGLTVVGLAMEAHGSSRPASGADHQIAHLWEMQGLAQNGEPVAHGACVAVGAVTVLSLYDWLLNQDLANHVPPPAPTAEARRAEIEAAFPDPAVAARALAETEAKAGDPAAREARLAAIRATWPKLRARLRGQLMPAAAMADRLRQAGCPTRAADIGVDPAGHREVTLAARFLRSRYTVLDLLDETGLLEPAVDAVFAQPEFRAA